MEFYCKQHLTNWIGLWKPIKSKWYKKQDLNCYLCFWLLNHWALWLTFASPILVGFHVLSSLKEKISEYRICWHLVSSGDIGLLKWKDKPRKPPWESEWLAMEQCYVHVRLYKKRILSVPLFQDSLLESQNWKGHERSFQDCPKAQVPIKYLKLLSSTWTSHFQTNQSYQWIFTTIEFECPPHFTNPVNQV